MRTAAVHDDNPEIQAARAKGVPVFERTQAWGAISKDYANAVCRPEIFKALARGFLSGGDFLVPCEKENLAFGGALMTLECGVRFLTDYLDGDHYFRIHRPEHNLDRCRTQFALVRSILAQEKELQSAIA